MLKKTKEFSCCYFSDRDFGGKSKNILNFSKKELTDSLREKYNNNRKSVLHRLVHERGDFSYVKRNRWN